LTTDVTKAGQVTEDGFVWAFAGGPVEGTPQASVKKRADGKVDGRSKGVRKCGKCGESGHNARTCGRQRKSIASLPASLRKPVGESEPAKGPESKPVPDQISAAMGLPVIERPTKSTPSGKAPKPRTMADRESARGESRASRKGSRKCGKCGQSGHNARTCSKGGAKPKVKHSRARQNTCGRCGGKGHNARTCNK